MSTLLGYGGSRLDGQDELGVWVARFCGECGSEVGPAAQFCRDCGAALGAGGLESSTEPMATRTPRAEAPQPNLGGAPHHPTPVGAPGPMPATGGSRAPLIAALAVVAVVVLAGIGTGAYLLLRDDSSDQSALEDWTYQPGDYASGAPPDEVSDPEDSAISDAGTDTTETGAAQGGAAIEPELEAGDYLQLGSFRGEGATREAARLSEHGIDAFVVDSDGVAELLPGFKVVVAGPLSGDAERRRIVRAGRDAGIGPLDKAFTPVTVSPDPAAVAGTFDGLLDQTSSQPRLNREVDATLTFAADGRSGSIAYHSPRCGSELEFAGTDRGTLTYDETVTSGGCADGGTWSVKPNDGEPRATWMEPDSDYFISGELTPGE